MKRILFVVHKCIFPVSTGPDNHIFSLISCVSLTEHVEVLIVYPTAVVNFENEINAYKRIGVKNIHLSEYGIRFLFYKKTLSLLRCMSLNCVVDSNSGHYIAKIEHQFDLICISHFSLLGLIDHGHIHKYLLCPHDAYSRSCAIALKSAGVNSVSFWVLLGRYFLYRSMELIHYKNFKLIAPITQFDSQYLTNSGIERCMHLPINTNYIQKRANCDIKSDNNRILLVGSFCNSASINDLKLVLDAFSVTADFLKTFKIEILHKENKPLLSVLKNYTFVDWVKWVNDYEEYLSGFGHVINVSISASGLQTKLLQAAAKGCWVYCGNNVFNAFSFIQKNSLFVNFTTHAEIPCLIKNRCMRPPTNVEINDTLNNFTPENTYRVLMSVADLPVMTII